MSLDTLRSFRLIATALSEITSLRSKHTRKSAKRRRVCHNARVQSRKLGTMDFRENWFGTDEMTSVTVTHMLQSNFTNVAQRENIPWQTLTILCYRDYRFRNTDTRTNSRLETTKAVQKNTSFRY